jgi:hypothetical protein
MSSIRLLFSSRSEVPAACTLSVKPLCNTVHDETCESSHLITVLLCRLDPCEDRFDPDADFIAACDVSDLFASTAGIALGEGAVVAHNVCQLILGIDIWNCNLSIEAAVEVELLENRAFSGRGKDQETTILYYMLADTS